METLQLIFEFIAVWALCLFVFGFATVAARTLSDFTKGGEQ